MRPRDPDLKGAGTIIGGIPFMRDAALLFGAAMNRVVGLIDGFNLYHVLHDCHPAHCKWCNYKTLLTHFLGKNDTLADVYYFTASATWDTGKVARHSAFVSALKHYGVKVVWGNFKKKYPKCRLCGRTYVTHEEKETDVNIAATLLSLAYEDAYDKALIVSGDSDYVSSIKMVKAKFPAKTIGAVIPFNPRKPHIASHMRRTADVDFNIERGHLLSSRLPNSILLSGGKTVTCPPEYLL